MHNVTRFIVAYNAVVVFSQQLRSRIGHIGAMVRTIYLIVRYSCAGWDKAFGGWVVYKAGVTSSWLHPGSGIDRPGVSLHHLPFAKILSTSTSRFHFTRKNYARQGQGLFTKTPNIYILPENEKQIIIFITDFILISFAFLIILYSFPVNY